MALNSAMRASICGDGSASTSECARIAASAWASSVASCWKGAVNFALITLGTARHSDKVVASGLSARLTLRGSGKVTRTSALVRSVVKSFAKSSASIDRNSGSSASGSTWRRFCSPCQRASTVFGVSAKLSSGRWQVAHERPLPPGY